MQQHCVLCGDVCEDTCGICHDCLADLPYASSSDCPQCGLTSNGLICGSCLRTPPYFDATYAVFHYAFPVDSLIQRYKYADMLALSHTFEQLLHRRVATSTIDCIIPMPMHPQRMKERGFNQALEIARQLDPNKLDYHSVTRTKLTPPQASLPFKARVKNIKGAFTVNGGLTGKRIAIVDDVITTGASLNELAKTLKKAGAGHVECWVVARTLPPR